MANIPVDETPNINLDMERFETKTPVHADEMNKRHKQHLDNEKALAFPEFDDGGTVSGISSFPEFLDMVKSKMRIFDFYKNFKAGMQFVLHTGMIVNNAATDNSKLPVSAAVAKDLQDQVTQLYSDLTGVLTSDKTYSSSSGVLRIDGLDLSGYYRIRLQIFLTDLTESVQIIELSRCAPNSNYAGYQSYYRNTGAIFWTTVFVDFDAGYIELRYSGTSGSAWTREFHIREIFGFAK